MGTSERRKQDLSTARGERMKTVSVGDTSGSQIINMDVRTLSNITGIGICL